MSGAGLVAVQTVGGEAPVTSWVEFTKPVAVVIKSIYVRKPKEREKDVENVVEVVVEDKEARHCRGR